MDITATWWQPRPPVALTFLGSEAQRPLRGAPTGTNTAAWGDAGKGFAVAFAANYFGPACGARDPEHYEVIEWPTEDEWRAIVRANEAAKGAPTPP